MWIERIIGLIFRRRHYWRSVSFDEISELYASRLMTVFALNLVNLFMAVYLYRLGYTLIFIALFYAIMNTLRALGTLLAAKFIAYAGPKHAVLLANIIRVFSMVALALVSTYGFPAIVAFGLLQQAAIALYALGYLVDFSKVRHLEHTGKELGTMQLLEKAARVVSPIIGGLIATFFSPIAVILVSAALFVVSAIPLFRTIEPTKTRARIVFEGFPWRTSFVSFVAQFSAGFDYVTSSTAWLLYVTVVVFAGAGVAVYSDLGWLISIGVIASMVATWFFGKVVDRRSGDILYSAGAISNSAIHLFRAFTTTPVGVAGINVANETMTTAYVLPFMRLLFDFADNSGHRILYVTLTQIAEALGEAVACAIFGLIIWLFGRQPGFQFFFVVAAAFELLLLTARRYTK
jgi:MFS family permease